MLFDLVDGSTLALVESLQEWAELLVRDFHYVGPFVVLLLCGLGLPLPEEVTLIACGLLVFRGEVDFTAISLVCGVAILAGDSAPYWLGRRLGPGALRKRWVRRVLHPERIRGVRRRFESHGNWVVFTCRFLPGIRIPGYFTAGILRMSFLRFLLLDALGVVISVPVSIYLAYLFAGQIERLKEEMEDLHLLLAFGLVSVLVILLVRVLMRRRARREAERRRVEGEPKSELFPLRAERASEPPPEAGGQAASSERSARAARP